MSGEAKRGWLQFCEAHGVTFTAMVEASGRMLDEQPGRMVEDNESVVELARRIDSERWTRKRR